MNYTIQASQRTPALIIYLIDISASMNMLMENRRRIDIVYDALSLAIRQMVFRSTKGNRLTPRYRIAILAYSDEVYDLLNGIKGIDEIASLGSLPDLTPVRFSDSAKAFQQAEKILEAELPHMQDCPAPLVCHMTDGVATGDDPEPVAKRIMQMSVPDGNVLVENIFISDHTLEAPIAEPRRWKGILAHTALKDEHAIKLRSMSSILPESYREMLVEADYHLAPGACMMLPGSCPELVSIGFQMSAATPVR
ncbi:vWA domain-containing protein [Paenibacillus apiarius]|uniref:VWA domain-containing protein n=1 Tax=Paenibacillus apiarius TaxID=46240 RepID=A0ABT4DPE5_9BACL|nr:vWA domain-containing protein [Paenibacillus apiarius]MBN3522482.1 VWA domain-containing protein [Paenibacillus apiarius]MCY9514665.1 VWA domain-containing protein [Paenibacillus apiarius]MCY9518655.1 VWA domain-containing protein [Paenibacillus apiarius]MCY9552905.1 VWA domain-containing protein [Paenibacillus apiarius]MCY9556929.1 VWA domain-containing protein [Paenibacillus apiarius]